MSVKRISYYVITFIVYTQINNRDHVVTIIYIHEWQETWIISQSTRLNHYSNYAFSSSIHRERVNSQKLIFNLCLMTGSKGGTRTNTTNIWDQSCVSKLTFSFADCHHFCIQNQLASCDDSIHDQFLPIRSLIRHFQQHYFDCLPTFDKLKAQSKWWHKYSSYHNWQNSERCMFPSLMSTLNKHNICITWHACTCLVWHCVYVHCVGCIKAFWKYSLASLTWPYYLAAVTCWWAKLGKLKIILSESLLCLIYRATS